MPCLGSPETLLRNKAAWRSLKPLLATDPASGVAKKSVANLICVQYEFFILKRKQSTVKTKNVPVYIIEKRRVRGAHEQ